MTVRRDRAREVRLRPVEDRDIDVFFEHQADPEAVAMAEFPGRERDEFLAHWAKVRADGDVLLRTIVADGAVAGNVVSWPQDGQRWVGYWLGREHWGRGIASRALALYLADDEHVRPLIAHVAPSNTGSRRVLEKSGFRLESETPDTVVFVLGG